MWGQRVMRTARVRNDQKIGRLAGLLTAIADAGGSVGRIQMLAETSQAVVRDNVIFAEGGDQMEHVLEAVRNNPGTRLMAVRDEALELHEKSKIAIRHATR